MRYRKLDENGDMTFGQGSLNFFVDSPEAVAQAAMTRLRLETGEWFLDVDEGTPYQTEVLGYGTAASRDVAISDRIVDTPGLTEITSYSSNLNPVTRLFTVDVKATTLYGPTTIQAVV